MSTVLQWKGRDKSFLSEIFYVIVKNLIECSEDLSVQWSRSYIQRLIWKGFHMVKRRDDMQEREAFRIVSFNVKTRVENYLNPVEYNFSFQIFFK